MQQRHKDIKLNLLNSLQFLMEVFIGDNTKCFSQTCLLAKALDNDFIFPPVKTGGNAKKYGST